MKISSVSILFDKSYQYTLSTASGVTSG